MLSGSMNASGTETPRERNAMKRLFHYFLLCVLWGGTCVAPMAGQDEVPAVDWRTGSEFRDAVEQTLSINWQAVPLRAALIDLSRRNRLAVFVDRRVDPNQEVTISANNVTYEQLMWQLAEKAELGVARVESVFYIGPRYTAERLPQLLVDASARMRGSGAARRLERKVENRWEQLTVPGDLLRTVSREADVEWASGNSLPHDLWPAGSWPRLSGTLRVALLLVGFDLWFERDGDEKWRMIPLPSHCDRLDWDSLTIEVAYDQRTRELVREYRAEKKDISFRTSGRRVKISGDPAEIARFMKRRIVGQTVSSDVPLSRRRYDLPNTTASRGAILATLAKQAGLGFQYTGEAVPSLQESVTVNVEQATLNELIDEVLKGSGLKFELKDGTIQIRR